MVDQNFSPPAPRAKTKGKLSLPPVDAGMNRLAPNNRGIEGKGLHVGPDIDADTSKPDKPAKTGKDDKKPGAEPEKGTRDGDEKLLDRMRKRFERCMSADAENRKAATDDLKFKAGNQWPADVAAQRNSDRRPMITNNRMKTFVHQVTNPARENRPQINLSPIGGKSDQDGAKMLRGLIRSIERDSHADIAYDTALESAVSNGFGYMRLLTEWKKEEGFDQVLVIKRVRNVMTCYLDPDHQEPDGSDSRFGFVTEMIPKDVFEDEYPDAQAVPFDLGGSGGANWSTKDGVRVAEYFEVELKPATLVSLSTGWIGWEDDMGEVLQRRVKDASVTVLDQRESNKRKVMYYKCSAVEVLERTEWIGKWIPVIKVIGDEIDIDGKVVLSGIIRDAKDAQRMANYWDTALTENVALAPKSHYIMEEGQLEGHEQEWKNANRKPQPVLTYKGTSVSGSPAPPPQRISPPDAPTGILAAAQAAQQNMMATTGIRFDATLQERMMDESGKALQELNRKTDIGAFHYYDNFRRSLEFLGKQLVDAIPKVYTARQVVTILREDDKEQTVTLDPMMGQAYREQKTDKGVMRYFNPSFGEYGVTVDIGPSYASKRQEASASMMDFVKALPNTASMVMDLIASEMDWPGAEKIAARLAKAIPPQLLTADMKDVPPQVQALIQNQEAQIKQIGLQLQAAMKELQSQQADRDVKMAKVQADYEIKLLQVIEKTEGEGKRLAVEQAKFVAETVMEELRTQRQLAHEHNMAGDARDHATQLAETAAKTESENKTDKPNAHGS